MVVRVGTLLHQGWRLRHALWHLLLRQLQARTRGSILGLGWLVLEPLFLFVLYTLVFGRILQVRFDTGDSLGQFALYLWCGLIPYNSLQQAVLASVGVLPGNRPLLLHTRFPGWLLPLVEVMASMVTEMIGLAILLLALGFGPGLSSWLGLVPVLLMVRGLLSLGLAWISSVLTVFLPDFGQLLRLLLTLGFFVTPIIYPPSMIPSGWGWLMALNPFHWLIAAYRSVFLEGAAPSSGFWMLVPASVLFAGMALIFFNRALGRAKDFL